MITIKDVQKYSAHLEVLYVEDNPKLALETKAIFELIFKEVHWAKDGFEGIEKYNERLYDLIITDINMPRMNGIDMIASIREINPEQKIVAISAHDESDILLEVLKQGVSGFILKPITLNEVVKVLYPVCRDAYNQNVSEMLFEELNSERVKLKKMVAQLSAQSNTVEIKNAQIGEMYAQSHPENRNELLDEYFAKDEDQGREKVLFMGDDVEEMTDLLDEIPDTLTLYTLDFDAHHIQKIGEDVAKVAHVLYRYTPFMDPLAQSLESLSRVIAEDPQFETMVRTKTELMLSLIDAVCIDLGLYVKRFSTESMAMRNIHHIHQPTTLSVEQIIHLIRPSQEDDGNDIEFF